jgi:glycosyltransferase involved in cell wall biosynthesis
MPHYDEGPDGRGQALLREAVKGVLAQGSSAWRLVIVDDRSPFEPALDALRSMAAGDGRIILIEEPHRRGPGHCRNVGIASADARGLPYVVFNDADDVSHPDRAATVAEIFDTNPATSVVYSRFFPVDDDDKVIPAAALTPSLREILEALSEDPPEGDDVWIDIATRTGYVNLTSATAVRTELALACPFPEEFVSEDLHTWFRYSAAGGRFHYEPAIPTRYRVRVSGAGSASRDRVGGADAFYQLKVKNDLDGFVRALELAIPLMQRFFTRIATSMAREGQSHLAEWAIDQAASSERVSRLSMADAQTR